MRVAAGWMLCLFWSTIALAQEQESSPRAVALHRSDLPAQPDPAAGQTDRLLRAAHDLESVGRTVDAAKCRREAAQILRSESLALLRQIEAELQRLEAEATPSETAGTVRLVLLEVVAAEYSPAKVKAAGLEIPWEGSDHLSLDDGHQRPYTIAVLDPEKSPFDRSLRSLQEQRLIRVMAEPKLVTVSGREANFRSGGDFPLRRPDTQGELVTRLTRLGTDVRFLPVDLGDGRIRLDCQLRVAVLKEIPSMSPEEDLFSPVQSFDVHAVATLRYGHTLTVRWGSKHDSADEETARVVFITPRRVKQP